MKHYRLCHKCNQVNSCDQKIERCEKCKIYFVNFYFSEELAEFLPADEKINLSVPHGKSRTILGICFKWTDS